MPIPTSLTIREIRPEEFELVWPIFHAVVSSGDTYAYSPDLTLGDARTRWAGRPARAFVVELEGAVERGPTDVFIMHRFLSPDAG